MSLRDCFYLQENLSFIDSPLSFIIHVINAIQKCNPTDTLIAVNHVFNNQAASLFREAGRSIASMPALLLQPFWVSYFLRKG